MSMSRRAASTIQGIRPCSTHYFSHVLRPRAALEPLQSASPFLKLFHGPPRPCSAFASFSTSAFNRERLGRIAIKRIPAHQAHHDGGYEAPPIALSSDLPQPHPKLRPTIWRPFLFSVIVATLAFAGAVYATNAETAYYRALIREKRVGFFGNTEPTDVQLAQARGVSMRFKLLSFFGLDGLGPQPPSPIAVLLGWWFRLHDGQRMTIGLIAVNAAVFVMWQVPAVKVKAAMVRSWLHYPLSGRSYTVLTSSFSHSTLMHFAFNMIALYSFGAGVHEFLSRRVRRPYDPNAPHVPEATPVYHFLAFYIAAALVAGFASHAFTLLVKAPRLLKWKQGLLSSAKPPLPILPSLGASGAIYACLTFSALAFPDAQVAIILLPMFPFSIGTGVLAMVTLDLVGLIRGWRMFDHVAHLGGALMGVLWFNFGGRLFDRARLLGWDDAAKKADVDMKKRMVAA